MAELLTQGDPEVVQKSRTAIEAIDTRLSNTADMFATGDIDAAQLTRISEQLRDEHLRVASACDID